VRELEGKAAIKEAVKRVRCPRFSVKPQDREHASEVEFIQVEKVTERALPRVPGFLPKGWGTC
jgi:hypothetical protein